MKKTLSFLLILCLLCPFLFSCKTKAPKLDDYKWKLASVQTEERGVTNLLYVSDKYVNIFKDGEDLPRINYTLQARRGEFILVDGNSDKAYYGTYDDGDEFSPDVTAYEIVLDGISGHALVTRAADSDGDDFYTLSISVDNYTLFFIR